MCEVAPGPRCASDTRTVCERSGSTYRLAYPKGPQVNPLAEARAVYGQGFTMTGLGDASRLRGAQKPMKTLAREADEREHAMAAAAPLPQDASAHSRRGGTTGASWVAPGLGESEWRSRPSDQPGEPAAPRPAPAPASTSAARTSKIPDASFWTLAAAHQSRTRQSSWTPQPPSRARVIAAAALKGAAKAFVRELTRTARGASRGLLRRVLVAPLRRAGRRATSPRWWRTKVRSALR